MTPEPHNCGRAYMADKAKSNSYLALPMNCTVPYSTRLGQRLGSGVGEYKGYGLCTQTTEV